jgi:hypothetical protein
VDFAQGTRPLRGPELYRLYECAVGRNIPSCKPYPFLARRVEWDFEPLLSECRETCRRDDRAVGGLSVAPDHLDEIERERPFDVGRNGPLIPVPSRVYDGMSTSPEVMKKSPRFMALIMGLVVHRWQAVEFHVVYRRHAIRVVVWGPATFTDIGARFGNRFHELGGARPAIQLFSYPTGPGTDIRTNAFRRRRCPCPSDTPVRG